MNHKCERCVTGQAGTLLTFVMRIIDWSIVRTPRGKGNERDGVSEQS